jgi:hypothetical protein
MKPQPPPILIPEPCTADWSAMTGDEQRRLCAQCNKHVHNLSALPPRKLQRFVEEHDGTKCIAYVLREDGTMVTAPSWPRLARFTTRVRLGSLWLLAFLLPSVFAGCAQRATNSYNGMMKGTPLPGKAPAPQHRNAYRKPDGQILLGEYVPHTERTSGKKAGQN